MCLIFGIQWAILHVRDAILLVHPAIRHVQRAILPVQSAIRVVRPRIFFVHPAIREVKSAIREVRRAKGVVQSSIPVVWSARAGVGTPSIPSPKRTPCPASPSSMALCSQHEWQQSVTAFSQGPLLQPPAHLGGLFSL